MPPIGDRFASQIPLSPSLRHMVSALLVPLQAIPPANPMGVEVLELWRRETKVPLVGFTLRRPSSHFVRLRAPGDKTSSY